MQKAITTLLSFLYYMYLQYSFYFELLGLAIIAYISFQLGKVSLREPIDKKVQELSSLMKTRKYLKQTLPKVYERFSKIKKIVIILLILIGCGLGAATYMG